MFLTVIIVLTLIDNNRWAIKTEQLEDIFIALTVSYVWYWPYCKTKHYQIIL